MKKKKLKNEQEWRCTAALAKRLTPYDQSSCRPFNRDGHSQSNCGRERKEISYPSLTTPRMNLSSVTSSYSSIKWLRQPPTGNCKVILGVAVVGCYWGTGELDVLLLLVVLLHGRLGCNLCRGSSVHLWIRSTVGFVAGQMAFETFCLRCRPCHAFVVPCPLLSSYGKKIILLLCLACFATVGMKSRTKHFAIGQDMHLASTGLGSQVVVM